jgi:putative MFS transporter
VGHVLRRHATGPITDRFGRKFGFAGTVLGFGVISGPTPLSHGVSSFIALRFASGLCQGGLVPVVSSVIAEYVAAKHRGKFVAILPVFGPSACWRPRRRPFYLCRDMDGACCLLSESCPALLAFVVKKKLPESPRWLAVKGKRDQVAKVLRQLGATETDVADLGSEKITQKPSLRVLLSPPY